MRCHQTPGDRHPTRADAEAAAMDKRINIALHGSGGSSGYHVRGCGCRGFHVLSDEQLEERKRRSRR